MKPYRISCLALFCTMAILFVLSCKKKFDTPPIKSINTGSRITIDSLRNTFQGTAVRFTDDSKSVYGVITADEVSGNLYKNVYLDDGTGAINVRLLSSGGLYQGDSVRINLYKTVLSSYNGMLQLDSVDVDNNVVKIAVNVYKAPKVVTISQINSSLQAKLIRLDSVQFIATEVGTTFANAITQQSANKNLQDCAANSIIVRTSGYANFAGSPVPAGKGSFIGIVGEYNGTMQLYIRNLSDLNLTANRCPGTGVPYLIKDYEDNNLYSGGWTTQQVSGSNINWTASSFSGNYFAKCSNFITPNNFACETWLISPAINLGSATNPILTFDNAYKYTGNPLQLMISTDYMGTGAPSTATWTDITSLATWSPGNFTFVNSGNISLNSYKQNGVYIAFKYTGTSTAGSTWEIDNIQVKEN